MVLGHVQGTPDAVHEQQLQQADTDSFSENLFLAIPPPPQQLLVTVTAAPIVAVDSQGVATVLPEASITEGQLHGTPAAAQFTQPQL